MGVLLVALAANAFAVTATVTILGKQVFDMTGRELDLGLLGFWEFLPVLLMAPLAGTLTDRFDRRRVLSIGIMIELATAMALWAYVRTDPESIGPILAIVFGFGLARSLVAPAAGSLLIDLAPLDQVERVVALRSVFAQTARILGPIAAGFVFVAGIELPYVMAAAVLAVALATVVFIPPTDVERLAAAATPRQALRDAWEGVRFIRTNPLVRGAITLDLFAVLLGGAVALLPAIADERLGVGAVGLGWLRAAVGIGALSVSSLLAVRPIRRRVGRMLLGAVAVFGVGTVVLGLTRSFVVAFLAIVVLSGADAVSVFIRITLVPLATPPAMRGRVLAVENVFIGASNELGAVESGVAAQFLGLVTTVVLGGVGTLLVVAVWWRLFPELVAVDRFAELTQS